MLGVVNEDGDAVAISDLDDYAGEDMNGEGWLGRLLLSRGCWLPSPAVLVVRAVVAVACIPTDIGSPIRGTRMPAVAARAVGVRNGGEQDDR